MKRPLLLTFVAVLFAALTLPGHLCAQSTNVKTPNKNRSTKYKSGIFKGSGNLIDSNSIASFIGGGQSNSVALNVRNAVIGGGYGNTVGNSFGTVGGGFSNAATGAVATVGGGEGNTAGSFAVTIGGGIRNAAQTNHATIGGGIENTNTGFAATIGGGELNTAESDYATAGGGAENHATGLNSTVAGGLGNEAKAQSATVGGGEENTAGDNYATVSGGWTNAADSAGATVAGGAANTTIGNYATVGGGFANTNKGNYAVVSGGLNNVINAEAVGAAIPGGQNNEVAADADYSVAAGYRAKANHAGSFVWADSTDADFASGAVNQFLVRAVFTGINRSSRLTANEVFGITSPQTDNFGGMYIRTSGATAKPFYGYSVNGGLNAWTYVDGSDALKWKLYTAGDDRMTVTANGLVGLGTTAPVHPLQMASGAHVTAGGAWVNASDVESKQNFRPIDAKQILAKVASLPISKWNYIAEPGVDRIGPTAQDFYAAFGLGADNKSIGTLDSDGVMYAAIKGLVEQLGERDQKIEELEAKSAEIDALKARLQTLEERLGSLPPASRE